MSKSYNVEAAQQYAARLRDDLLGQGFRHWKGGHYIVVDIVVDEATGEPRITYLSQDRGWRWSRTLNNFVEMIPNPVDGTPLQRFTRIG